MTIQEVRNNIQQVEGVNVLIEKVHVDLDEMKRISFMLKAEYDDLFIFLASDHQDKATFTLMISEELAKKRGWNASQLISYFAVNIKGKGNGVFFFGVAEGEFTGGIDKSITEVKDSLFGI
jgi:alanyl-tRNA synthetase